MSTLWVWKKSNGPQSAAVFNCLALLDKDKHQKRQVIGSQLDSTTIIIYKRQRQRQSQRLS